MSTLEKQDETEPGTTKPATHAHVDGDGEVKPATDALLILRYSFGFREATLITGAVDADCTRCDVTSIEVFLSVM